ncbi:MAG TPA: hypothetical protein PLD27_08050 [bacterium]|nr:hypothetical protein [bacterium]HOL48084.1 hypothetical protein [bacterium]HPQ19156.1 hypothetical protein [bacterium]
MTEQEYYKSVFEKLKNCFKYSYYVLGFGSELIKYGWSPNGLLVAVEDISSLWKFTCEYCLQVFIPIIGINTDYILAPLDFEISLTSENYKLYEDKDYQKYFFLQIFYTIKYIEKIFLDRKIYFLLDLTPSGGHILFYVKRGTKAFNELQKIGYLEDDLKNAYKYKSNTDLQRKFGVKEDSGLVFSGLGRLSEYIGLKSIKEINKYNSGFSVTLCDSSDKSINYDNSWAGDPAYKRIMRSPFSLHKKNTQKYGKYWQNSLVDIIKVYYNFDNYLNYNDIDYLINCMWDLNLAAEHSKNFSGYIPIVNDNLCSLINEYKKSDLYKYHQEFDKMNDVDKNGIINKVNKDENLDEETKNILKYPEPALLQPKKIKHFVYNLLSNNYTAKEIANIINGYYQNPKYYWHTDWLKYPSKTRANFWARMYSSLYFFENGKIKNL